MKLSIITLGAVIASGALARVETLYRDDGSISKVLSMPDHGVSAAISSREPHQAEEVVAAKTKKPGKPGRGKSNGSSRSGDEKDKEKEKDKKNHRLSRRCVKHCSIPLVPLTPACRGQGGHCTIDNFAKVCCPNKDNAKACYFPTGNPQQGYCQL
ncbi:hypothetical protein QBC34DRAFT_462462 [Podospora aff. communis PSN243]|uniref:Uncharacterized protein n=1 Tax=Podospora aff. communis PSN243 TaxID=3040156 RepID=A0AAV9GR80_9PEZI|nr:hypothetical protein QBC34DRAFT_462462 [Podospora aff. communis PSN243]